MTRRALWPALLPLASCSRRKANVIRMAVYQGAGGYATVPLAESLGYFVQEGLSVELDEFASVAKALQAVLGGSAEVAATAFEQILLASAAGKDTRCFFVLATRPANVLAALPGRTRIERLSDLKGRTVGVTTLGSVAQNVLSLALIRNGMSLSDVAPVAIGTGAASISALEAGKVDAAVLNSLAFETLRLRHPGIHVLYDSRTEEGSERLFGRPHIAGAALAALPRWLAENREAARKLGRAVSRASRWTRVTPADEVLPRMPEWHQTPGSPAARHALQVSLSSLSEDGRMPPGAPEAVRDYLRLAANGSLDVDLGRTYTEEFLEGKG